MPGPIFAAHGGPGFFTIREALLAAHPNHSPYTLNFSILTPLANWILDSAIHTIV